MGRVAAVAMTCTSAPESCIAKARFRILDAPAEPYGNGKIPVIVIFMALTYDSQRISWSLVLSLAISWE
jgi:hypothetical protein